MPVDASPRTRTPLPPGRPGRLEPPCVPQCLLVLVGASFKSRPALITPASSCGMNERDMISWRAPPRHPVADVSHDMPSRSREDIPVHPRRSRRRRVGEGACWKPLCRYIHRSGSTRARIELATPNDTLLLPLSVDLCQYLQPMVSIRMLLVFEGGCHLSCIRC